jgi:hypothetical protein
VMLHRNSPLIAPSGTQRHVIIVPAEDGMSV